MKSSAHKITGLLTTITLMLSLPLSAETEPTVEERLQSLEKEVNFLRETNKSNSSNPLEGLSINGYVNFVLSQSTEDTPYWSGEDTNLSLTDHSSAGIRLTSKLSDKTHAVIQAQATTLNNDDYEIDIEWFYAQHYFTENLSVKLGRLSAPILNYSEEFEVGFAYPWIRPPEEVYGPLPLNEIEGISFAYDNYFGNFGISAKATWGYTTFDFGTATITHKNIIGLETEFSYKALTFRASQLRMKFNGEVNVQTVISNGSTPAPGLPIGTIVNYKVKIIDTDYTLTSVGFTFNNNSLFLTGEFSDYQLKADTPVFSDEQGYYVTAGWYLGNFTPYYTYAELEADDTFVLDPMGSPTPLIGRTQRSQYIGLRYNTTDKSAITLQAQYIDKFGDSIGLFGGPSGGFDGVTIDFDDAIVFHLAFQAIF